MCDVTDPTTMADLPAAVLALVHDDATSHWLRVNLWDAIALRDPLDALADAQALAQALEEWAAHVFRRHGLELPI